MAEYTLQAHCDTPRGTEWTGDDDIIASTWHLRAVAKMALSLSCAYFFVLKFVRTDKRYLQNC